MSTSLLDNAVRVDVLTLDPGAAQFKTAETVTTGLRTLEFYAAAFSDVPDLKGDTIAPDAFDTWLDKFYTAGRPLPISFSHAAVLDDLDPTNVIGYAPADPEHVWVDDYGLRIKSFLDTTSEKGRAVEWQIDNNLIGGASMAYGNVKRVAMKSRGSRITHIGFVREAGPTPDPANQEAVLLWLKSQGSLEEPQTVPYMTVDEFRETFETKALDDSAWDANRAMGECSSAADYRSICAGEKSEGEPDQRQHWALPHYFLGRDANAAGVAAARARFDQTEGLSNKSAARAHLFETHRLPSDAETASEDPDIEVPEMDALLLKHAASPTHLQAAHDALVRAGVRCAADSKAATDDETKEEKPPVETTHQLADELLARLRLIRAEVL